jgi:hypothetical protein
MTIGDAHEKYAARGDPYRGGDPRRLMLLLMRNHESKILFPAAELLGAQGRCCCGARIVAMKIHPAMTQFGAASSYKRLYAKIKQTGAPVETGKE